MGRGKARTPVFDMNGVRQPRGANHRRDNALGDLEERRGDVNAVGDGSLGQCKPEEDFEYSFRALEGREVSRRFHHPGHEEQHQQGVGNGPERRVDAWYRIPHGAAPEILRGGGDQCPYFRHALVPGTQGGV